MHAFQVSRSSEFISSQKRSWHAKTFTRLVMSVLCGTASTVAALRCHISAVDRCYSSSYKFNTLWLLYYRNQSTTRQHLLNALPAGGLVSGYLVHCCNLLSEPFSCVSQSSISHHANQSDVSDMYSIWVASNCCCFIVHVVCIWLLCWFGPIYSAWSPACNHKCIHMLGFFATKMHFGREIC